MKEEGIEILDLIKGPKSLTINLPRGYRTGVIIVQDVEAGRRNFTNGIFPLNQIVPIRAQIAGVGILS